MVANNKKRATSTLSPVPDALQSPVSMHQTTRETIPTATQLKDRAKVKDDIIRHLKNDGYAISGVRKSILKELPDGELKSEEIKLKQTAAALAKIKERKRSGKYAGSKYPVFKNYIPIIAYQESSKGTAEQQNPLIEKQLDRLCGSLFPVDTDDEEGDDEEQVPVKKQEDEDTKDLGSIEPYAAKTTKSKGGSRHAQKGPKGAKTMRRHKDTSMPESVGYVDESEDEDDEVSGTESELSELESETGSDSEQDDEGEDEGEEDHAPMVAVSRGRPLTNNNTMPTKAYVNLKQHFATGIKCVEQAVIRGQVLCNNNDPAEGAYEENKGVVSKKRIIAEHEDGGRKFKKVKAKA